MTTMNAEVYDALRAVNVPEDKARRAAETMGSHGSDLTELRNDFKLVRGEFSLLREQVNGRFTLLQWMIGFNLAMTVALLWKVFAGH